MNVEKIAEVIATALKAEEKGISVSVVNYQNEETVCSYVLFLNGRCAAIHSFNSQDDRTEDFIAGVLYAEI